MPSHESEIIVLAKTIWGEARGEPKEGQEWVAWVVKNRVLANKSYWGGNTYQGVCLHKLQFECWNDGPINIRGDDPCYMRMLQIASDVYYANPWKDPTGGCDHFHAPSKEPNPPWKGNCNFVRTISGHDFYRAKRR